MRLIWLESALEDQDAILDYIAERNEGAARKLQSEIDACSQRLLDFPFMYHSGRAPGTREALAHPNYILIYRVQDDLIEIVNLVHARQQYPPT
ncbi:MAG TPA: type II toxin-antitoxin system RelE/ParE family toxin [Sphingomonadaceae bacterium]